MKAQYVIDLLKSNSNRFTPAQLESATGSPRRARRALFLARKAGLALEAIRDSGRAVTAYVANGAIPTVAAAAPARKASKSAAVRQPKAEPAVKVDKTKPVKTATTRKPKADKPAKTVKAIAAPADVAEDIKAKNLATIKAVHAKVKQKVHPITARPMTDEEADVLDEFRAMEAEYEAEQERLAARAAVRENLPKEAYSE
jgi:hypothetical protein